MSERRRLPWWGLALVGLVVVGAVLAGAHAAQDILPRYFDTTFHQLLTANLVGVALGAFFAFAVDRRRTEEHERREERRARREEMEAAKNALGALEDVVEHNDELVSEIQKSLSTSDHVVVYFSTDFKGIDPILPRVMDSTGNLDLVREASDYRHGLKHLTRKLEAQFDLFLQPEYAVENSKVGKSLRRKRRKIVDSIRQNDLPTLVETADKLRDMIDATDQEP